ncbi:helix-turn-helix domain-containing protein [Bacillus sp. ISL-47]|uniref:helix-turn-helix domain-containing protein n=1 Tax=Bacillus sp. ISL-47 TaxID=2819130 RepID=UPI001BEC38A9|nr:helix-turn-helix domain-containing protein [Bacillus sp. ISL-47]MBT2686933.1 helix-turn-helix domain-containing protein [Bacillus sp. ISL-47]MBT2707767.1 helix-turn-helix domain-containing protein [Pseudomonas sp. ISL-84]
MENSYLKIVILYCIKELKGQRTIFSILHLLNGKKSSQTIQDAHLFQLTRFFKTFGQLSRSELEQHAKEMEAVSWISQDENSHFVLTAEGERYLQSSLLNCPIPSSLNGWKYHTSTGIFWERLSLLVQVMSHLNYNHTKYLPIQRKREIHAWLKAFLKTTGAPRNELGKLLNKELQHCLGGLSDMNPAVLTLRLTGFNHIGLTPAQAAEHLGVSHDYYHHQFLGVIHYILDCLIHSPSQYPLLGKLISGSEDSVPLTFSTKKTYSLLNRGLGLDEIAQIRNLKRSTIEDHVVEVALNESNFDISPYVADDRQKSILKAANSSESRQLKQIRQLVPDADYFEIRLVLAKFGEER